MTVKSSYGIVAENDILACNPGGIGLAWHQIELDAEHHASFKANASGCTTLV